MGWGGQGKGQSWGKQSWSPGGNSWGGNQSSWGGKGWESQGKGYDKGKRKTDPETTAWIGGLPEDEASVKRNKALVEHMKQAGDCRFVKIGRSGTGAAHFTTKEEVQ